MMEGHSNSSLLPGTIMAHAGPILTLEISAIHDSARLLLPILAHDPLECALIEFNCILEV